ncbi:MAG TPA: hypothetical protein VIK21_08640, partial [Desulfuromonadaceae bacterium]
MKHLKLGTKLLLGGLLALAIPVIIIGVVSVYESSRSISKMQKEDMISIAESLAGALGIGMTEQLMTVRNISYSNSVIATAEKVVREGEKNSQKEILFVQKELTKMKDAEGDRFSSISLVGKNGIV